jgi:protein-S-isoprenylcysteine O-methyltransferase Ste14
VFGTVLVAGFVLVIRRPALWLFLPAIILMQTFRARHEARALEAAFADAYREYRRNTWFLKSGSESWSRRLLLPKTQDGPVR